ncbi:gas vesicle protein [Burkholderia multivorans]|uniref:gas vesicle accessory protein GvpU n=1 Tax=Burkholderia multivorans TaxID=87883 RepID=UPI001C22AB34|nr:gas vesicle accessory protein GvpU [Burkholderia multivorans]MBU9227474.1 gas vesicle protein [Burkholderia multivorans]
MNEQTTKTDAGPQHVITTAENDWFLQELVRMVNCSDTTIGITLFVGGVLISGLLIGGKHYFEGFASTFADGIEDPDTATFYKNEFGQHANVFVEPDGTYKQDLKLPHFIHLKDARTFHPSGNPIPGKGGTWWRGRIREVDGFTLGKLSQD